MLSAMYARGDIDLRYADETSFSMTPNVPYGWLPKGKQRGIASDPKRVLNVFALLNPGMELSSFPTQGTINAQYIINCIESFLATNDKLTVIVMDNAPWHKAKMIEDKIEHWQNQGLFIFYLPTYSPHLNLIEILWRKMKYEWLRPQDFINPQALHDAIINILKNFGNEFSIKLSMKLKLLRQFRYAT